MITYFRDVINLTVFEMNTLKGRHRVDDFASQFKIKRNHINHRLTSRRTSHFEVSQCWSFGLKFINPKISCVTESV